jgi:formylglycine-generating enzyme required for sulfatase activity
MLNTLAILAVGALQAPAVQDGAEGYVERLEDTLVSFRMVRLPNGGIEIDGKRQPLHNLWIGEREVTWDLFGVWAFRLDQTEDEMATGVDAESRPSRPYGAPDRGFGHTGYPAIGMTFDSAKQFCVWLSAKTGKRYRLPTEAEWEYAARAGSREAPSLETSSWFWDNADDKTHPVARKKPNAWGLYDMLGNVSEWATDADGKPVACGGSFLDKAADVGFSARARQTPRWNSTDPQNPKSRWWLSDAPFVGFRLVREL